MKNDIDELMREHQIDAILVSGPAQHNPFMVFFTGIAHLTQGDLIKKRGEDAVLFHASMERDEARLSGLHTISYEKYPFLNYLDISNGDRIAAIALRYKAMLAEMELTSGRIMVYGQLDGGVGFEVFREIEKLLPELTILGDRKEELLPRAMETKGHDEIGHIFRMGQITTRVVAKTAEYLSDQYAVNGVLQGLDGKQITIGDVKRKVNLWLTEESAENPEDTIFAIGRDAGVPHSSGSSSDPLKTGQTIIFDIFPCEAGGGYYYDFTRTWCLGYAPDDVLKLYEQVRSVYGQLVKELRSEEDCSYYQERTCELFSSMGHPTVDKDPAIESGYVHSVGHGVGLHIHERPWLGKKSSKSEVLTPGMVFTIEPGLYYPDKGMGVRLEDTYMITPGGDVQVIAEYPLDLILPVKSKS